MSLMRIGIVGAGTIGASWAAFYLARGFEVVVTDPAAEADAFVRHYIRNAWPVLEQLGSVIAGATPERISFHHDLSSALDDVGFVQESGPEREDLKVKLFAQMDAVLPPEVIIASSSSGLLMTRLQAGCKVPERCVIGHPFNPPHLIPLVEVVGGERTSPDIVERALAFYRSLGKHPIRLQKEVRGHVANRLQAALWREAIHLVGEGVASVADIDAAVTFGPGLRWPICGPHMTFHLGGGIRGMEHFMAHLLESFESFWEDLGAPEMTPELQRRVIEGVYAEADGRSVAELAETRDRRLISVLKAVTT